MKKLLILLLFPLMMFAQDSTLIGDVDCSGEVNSQDASLILQFVTNVIDSLPCEANMTGLTPEQLQEMIDMMEDQLNINYNGCSSFGEMIDIDPGQQEYFQFENDGFLLARVQGGYQSTAALYIKNNQTEYIYQDAIIVISDATNYNGYSVTIPVKEGQYLIYIGSVEIFGFWPSECEESTTSPNNNSGSNNKTLMYTIDGF